MSGSSPVFSLTIANVVDSSPIPPSKIAWRTRRAIFSMYTLWTKVETGPIRDWNWFYWVENHIMFVRFLDIPYLKQYLISNLCRSPTKTLIEHRCIAVEEFLQMIRFDFRDKLTVLPGELLRLCMVLHEAWTAFPIVFRKSHVLG